MQPANKEIERIIETALKEDIGPGDITGNSVIAAETIAELSFVTREDIILCGLPVMDRLFEMVDAKIAKETKFKDGDRLKAGQVFLTVKGNARKILAAERVALNLLQRMAGIATLTAKYVNEVKHTKAKILDTRKTMPGLRAIDKYAVKMGGGENHRMGLYDAIMIKDNHISIAGGVKAAIMKAKANMPGMAIEVECDTPEQAREAAENGADRLLLDNMDPKTLKEIVVMIGGRLPLEASGGITLANVREVAETGVDYISIGALTHSASNADIGLDMIR